MSENNSNNESIKAPSKDNTSQNIPGDRHGNRFAEVEHAQNAMETTKRILAYFAKEKMLVLAMLAVVIFGTLCGVYAPSLQSKAIDIIAGEENGALLSTILLMLAVYLIYCVCQLLQSMVSAYLSQHIVRHMRDDLFGKIIDLPIRYLDVHSHGDVMSRMTNDIENISTTVSQSLPSLFSGVLTIIGTMAIMLWYCWQLALLSFVTVFLTVFATEILSKQVRKYSRQRQQLLGRLNGTVEEMVSGVRTVVAYNHQDITIDEFCETADSMTKAGIRTDSFSGVMGPVMNCIGNIGFVIIAAFGGYFSIKGLISVGVISAFIVYAKQFSRPINEIAQVYGQLQTAIAGAERVFFILDEADEDHSGEPYQSSTATVKFEHVNFSYEYEKPVIRDFSLTVPSGKKVALVGATGSGKTTIVNLLMRFYDIDSGRILINNQDLKDISRESLRKNIAIVLQDTVLFTDTVGNNLKYGNSEATDEQLDNAVKMSRCQELIQMLPQGYDTILTGSGENISQGQRQLLAIARAFVMDPKILILDEATSNVDTRTEKAIQDAMQRIMENRTSIVIAHRLSTIRDSDIIVVMDHGTIAESGSHDELLARHGKYYELYMTQYAGFAT
ncbi:MAG: ABC transporter ATP-binding protein/permease [Clostridiales bacterium]|nr:ABC transporter ATP-binding protein/permease [Clostridiales bacterium]